jgi:hypothetical protein
MRRGAPKAVNGTEQAPNWKLARTLAVAVKTPEPAMPMEQADTISPQRR